MNNITQDSKGNLWFSTSGSGLDLYRPATNDFENFDKERNGLASDCIYETQESPSSGKLLLITNEGFLPTEKEALTGLEWHTYRNKPLRKYHYERRKNSQAYIPYNSGEHYYQGGLIGGESKAYIELLEQCSLMTETDLKRNITARWHDESYLNKYLLDKQIKILSTEYGRPQEWTVPPTPKIIFRDKNAILGASYICSLKKRNRLKLISKAIRNILNKLPDGCVSHSKYGKSL